MNSSQPRSLILVPHCLYALRYNLVKWVCVIMCPAMTQVLFIFKFLCYIPFFKVILHFQLLQNTEDQDIHCIITVPHCSPSYAQSFVPPTSCLQYNSMLVLWYYLLLLCICEDASFMLYSSVHWLFKFHVKSDII